MGLYLYDPKTNVSTETTYAYLVELTGMKLSTLRTNKSKRLIIRNLGCYIIDKKTTLKERQEYYAKVKIDDEVWVDIEGSDGTYVISNHGRIKRVYKSVEPRFIMPYIRKDGYQHVRVRFNGEYKVYRVARLVAHHFLGPNKNGLSVRHKNGIKTDCFSGNLEYITKQKLGKLTGAKAGSIPIVQLCPRKMTLIDEFRSAEEAGRRVYLSGRAVLDNCIGRTEKAAGMKFMFLEEYQEMKVAE